MLYMNIYNLEAKLRLSYDIPDYLSFTIENDNNSCPLCKDKDIFHFSAPFIEADVPYNKIVELIKGKFGISISEDIIYDHIPHFSSKFDRDASLQERQKREMMLLKSSLPAKANLDEVIEDNIVGLQSRLLEIRAGENVGGKEFIETSKTLMNWIALKKKLIGELNDSTTIDLSDVIKFKRMKEKMKGESHGTKEYGDVIKDSIKFGQRVAKTETSSDGKTERISN